MRHKRWGLELKTPPVREKKSSENSRSEPRADKNRNGPAKPRRRARVTLRRAVPGDLDAILGVELASFTNKVELFNRRQVRGLLANPRAVASLATLNRRVVGWAVGLLRGHRKGAPTGRVYALAVHPDARGHGVGRRLLLRTMRGLEKRGARRIYLEVRKHNHPAIALYLTHGFEPRKPLRHYYGRGEHGVSMARKVKRRPK